MDCEQLIDIGDRRCFEQERRARREKIRMVDEFCMKRKVVVGFEDWELFMRSRTTTYLPTLPSFLPTWVYVCSYTGDENAEVELELPAY